MNRRIPPVVFEPGSAPPPLRWPVVCPITIPPREARQPTLLEESLVECLTHEIDWDLRNGIRRWALRDYSPLCYDHAKVQTLLLSQYHRAGWKVRSHDEQGCTYFVFDSSPRRLIRRIIF
jgi:hypothetical protein